MTSRLKSCNADGPIRYGKSENGKPAVRESLSFRSPDKYCEGEQENGH